MNASPATIQTPRDRAIAIARSAAGFALLREIEQENTDEGCCHTGHIVHDDPDYCPRARILFALCELDLVDTDQCSGCDNGATTHWLTPKGRFYLHYAGSDAGLALLTTGSK